MSRWFRLYSEVVNDPKVQRLPCEDFRAWINILCLCAENEGRLPAVEDISFALRFPQDGVLTLVERLSNGGLIDRVNGGPNGWHYAPHGWAKRQYKSDTSTERVKRFRKRSVTVSETAPEAETDTEQKIATNVAISPEKKTRSKSFRFVPEDWRPGETHGATAKAEGMDRDAYVYQVQRFREFEFKKPITNLDLAFHRWLRNTKEFSRNDKSDAKLAARHENYAASWSGAERASDIMAARRNL